MGDVFKSPIYHSPTTIQPLYFTLKPFAGCASWAEINQYQSGSPSLHGHIWSLGSTYNHSNKLGSGGSPIPAALHSARPPKHLSRVKGSPPSSQLKGTESMLSRQPVSRLGAGGQQALFTLPAEEGMIQTHS